MREEIMPLLKPDNDVKSEPHLIALMSNHSFAFIVPYPDTMHLDKSLNQPDRAEYIKSMK